MRQTSHATVVSFRPHVLYLIYGIQLSLQMSIFI